MALTKEAVEGLGARVIAHEDVGPGIQLENGAIKTALGLIVQPSTEPGGTRSGKLLSEEQPQSVHAPVEEPAQQPERRGRKRAQKTTQEIRPEAAPARQLIRVDVEVEGFGTVPTQYSHVYPGVGLLILGLSEVSFIPAQYDATAKRLVGFSTVPGRKYAYLGNKFTDSSGIVNIVMIEMRQ